MLITDILKRNAELYPDENALIAIDLQDNRSVDDAVYNASRRVLTWRQFNDCANQIASYYISMGLGKGHHIGMMLRNTIEWMPIYFGILKSGAVAVPLNFRYTEEQLIHHLHQADIDALIVGGNLGADLSTLQNEISFLKSLIFVGPLENCPAGAGHADTLFSACSRSDPNVVIDPSEMAAIYFSSGTTGLPKAVVYSHETLECACFREYSVHHQVHEDIFICIPPLYHVGAKLHWMGNLLVGAPGVFLLNFSVKGFLEAISREKVTIAFLLIPWIQDLFAAVESGRISLGDYDLPHLRLIHMGAQLIPKDIIEKLQVMMPFAELGISYGLTESGGPDAMAVGHECIIKDAGCIGRPPENWQAKLIDDKGREVPDGRLGEILLKGPGMMMGYYKAPEKTAEAFTPDGWLHTGDIAKRDSDGFYYFKDRLKDIIISGGENICPSYIEDFFRDMPEVKDAAVFGVPDSRYGEAVVAAISLMPDVNLTADDLLMRTKKLSTFMQPKEVVIANVPRNPTGKIDKVKLRNDWIQTH